MKRYYMKRWELVKRGKCGKGFFKIPECPKKNYFVLSSNNN
jgi:hypothetical protein